MYFVLITVGCNCVVVCVNCRIESGILIYFFFGMHVLCMLSHITCIVQGSVIVFWVREITYTKCLITLCASIFQLYNLVAFESSTDVGLPLLYLYLMMYIMYH